MSVTFNKQNLKVPSFVFSQNVTINTQNSKKCFIVSPKVTINKYRNPNFNPYTTKKLFRYSITNLSTMRRFPVFLPNDIITNITIKGTSIRSNSDFSIVYTIGMSNNVHTVPDDIFFYGTAKMLETPTFIPLYQVEKNTNLVFFLEPKNNSDKGMLEISFELTRVKV